MSTFWQDFEKFKKERQIQQEQAEQERLRRLQQQVSQQLGVELKGTPQSEADIVRQAGQVIRLRNSRRPSRPPLSRSCRRRQRSGRHQERPQPDRRCRLPHPRSSRASSSACLVA